MDSNLEIQANRQLVSSGFPHPRAYNEGRTAMKEVNLDGLNPADTITLHTENGSYNFAVINPDSRHGILMGRRLGREFAHAILAGGFMDEVECLDGHSSSLAVGERAVFYIPSTKGVMRLITSPIQEITYAQDLGERATVRL